VTRARSHKAPALAALFLAAGCAHERPPPPPVRPSPQVGRPLELAAPDLAGRVVDVAAQQGKVRLVDFWATWCEPCRDALPALDRMARELGPRGLLVYGVSFDEDPAQIAPFLAQVPVGFPVLHDRGGEVLTARFLVSRLPTTLLVDRRGVIRFVHEGWTPERAREAQRQVEQLLAEP
jgi:thiol-disulfide isomerase/thioredoxin